MDFEKYRHDLLTFLNEKKVGGTTLNDVLVKSSLFLLLLILIPLMFSSGKSEKSLDMKIGSISTKKVVAPFTFYILKTDEELQKEREASVQKVPYYFTYNDSITKSDMNLLSAVAEELEALKAPRPKAGDSLDTAVDSFYVRLKTHLQESYGFNFSSGNLRILLDILSNKENRTYFNQVIAEAKRYLKNGILSINLSQIDRPNISVIHKGIEENLPESKRMDLPGAYKALENKLLEHFVLNQTVVLNYYFTQLLKPNLIYEKKMTEDAVEQAIAGVATTKDIVYENERIVDANERIDAEIYQKLYSLKAARIERSRREGNWQESIAFVGKMMLLVAILLIGVLYLFSFRRKIYKNNKYLLLITVILLLEFILAAIITGPLNWHSFIIPTTIVSMLLAILIDSGIAFVGTVIVALVLGGVQGSGFDIGLLTLVSGMVSIFAVHKIRTRNQVFKAIVYIGLAYLWVIVSLTAIRYDSLLEASKIFTYNLLPNAVLSPFITFMILGVFEKLFDITTDVTLLELSDLNHPLLKKLSLEAPGTFHHSMVVGNLAESAAKAIGANPLLARVGSYYHDVGKMEKPEYFIENQMDAANRHNQLAPSMSALILTSHVKNGIELAAEYGIPKLIRNFIPEHHGTSLMKYFYNKAQETAGDSEVNEATFRYPGPKPQTKETGIVMLADSVEAATRSISNPTPTKIRAFVEDLVDQRFRDGELDECDLTLRDLKQIIDAFMPVLYGVFQHRIEYPDQEKKKTAAKTKAQNGTHEHSHSAAGPKNPAQ